jgi:hypothetical protein
MACWLSPPPQASAAFARCGRILWPSGGIPHKEPAIDHSQRRERVMRRKRERCHVILPTCGYAGTLRGAARREFVSRSRL